jgi:hypothetical protein
MVSNNSISATVVHLRRGQRKDNAGVYGIASDGVRFSFYHMTAGGVVSIIFAEIT